MFIHAVLILLCASFSPSLWSCCFFYRWWTVGNDVPAHQSLQLTVIIPFPPELCRSDVALLKVFSSSSAVGKTSQYRQRAERRAFLGRNTGRRDKTIRLRGRDAVFEVFKHIKITCFLCRAYTITLPSQPCQIVFFIILCFFFFPTPRHDCTYWTYEKETW